MSEALLNFPIRFNPIFQYRVWGGNKLAKVLNKDTTVLNAGESWEISAVSNFETKVAEGPLEGQNLAQLIHAFGPKLLGENVWNKFGSEFPLLIKFIDADQPLSVQVHPNDEWARKHHNSFGKNEMWYILDAAPDADLILGFNQHIKPDEFDNHINSGTLERVLHTEKVVAGDAFFIPTGLVHAIGGGVLLAEIQQTSDVTYRIYDYNRIDLKSNKKRTLHLKDAKSVADFAPAKSYATPYDRISNKVNDLISTPYFKTDYLRIKGTFDRSYSELDSFVILIGVSGTTKLECLKAAYFLAKGEVLLLPAAIQKVIFIGEDSEIIEVFIP